MAGSQRALGIVVGGLNYGESDRIVTFLTRQQGRLKGIARGARKSRRRFGAALELLNKVEVQFVERANADLVRLDGCDLVDGYGGVRGHLDRIAMATYAAELAREAAQEREPAPALFDLLDELLAGLAAGPPSPGAARVFELRALDLLGWRPELDACARCGAALPEEGRVLFTPREGGTLCRRCGAGVRGWGLSPGTLKTLRSLLGGVRVSFTELALRESEQPIGAFLEMQIGKRLRSRSFLDAFGGEGTA